MNLDVKIKTYIINTILVSATLGIFTIANWHYQNKLQLILQFGLSVFFMLTIIPVYRKKFIEFFSNIILYLTGFSTIFNATVICPEDQIPLVGLLTLQVPAYFLLKKKNSFIMYSSVIITAFVIAIMFNLIDLPVAVAVKFVVIYSALMIMIDINSSSDRLELEKAVQNEKKLKEIQADLQKNIKNLEDAKDRYEKLNNMMVGRELKMIELKEMLEKLKK